MPAINLYINKNIISHEIRNNVIILKKNNAIVYEFPVPKNYHLFGIIEYKNRMTDVGEVKEKRFIITKGEQTLPPFIPEGFGNLHVSTRGTWCVEEILNQKADKIKKLDYINTSTLTLNDFKYVYYGNARVNYLFENGFKIPEGFWVSTTYHCDYYNPSRNIQDIPKYMEDFGYGARLIREDECMSLIALNDSFQLAQGKIQNLYTLCDGYRIVSPEFGVVVGGHIPDNWRIVASSTENQNVYRFLWPSLFNLSHNPALCNYSIDVPYYKLGTYMLFPVIDAKQDKILKHTING